MPLLWLNGRQTEIYEKTNALDIGGAPPWRIIEPIQGRIESFYINESLCYQTLKRKPLLIECSIFIRGVSNPLFKQTGKMLGILKS